MLSFSLIHNIVGVSGFWHQPKMCSNLSHMHCSCDKFSGWRSLLLDFFLSLMVVNHIHAIGYLPPRHRKQTTFCTIVVVLSKKDRPDAVVCSVSSSGRLWLFPGCPAAWREKWTGFKVNQRCYWVKCSQLHSVVRHIIIISCLNVWGFHLDGFFS